MLDRFSYDANPVALIIFTRRESHLVTLRRITGGLDRQGQVVDFYFAALVTLRIRAVVRGWFAGETVEQLGRQGRITLLDRVVERG